MKKLFTSLLLLIAALFAGAEDEIKQFMSEHWSQTKPYNDLMPRYLTEADAGDGQFVSWDGKAPTGCVATQMAQLFHYWKWPSRFDYLYSSGVSQSVAVEDKGKYSIVLQVNGWVPYSFDESDLTKARLSYLAAVLGKINFNRNGSGGRPEEVAKSLAENNVEARKYYDYKGMTSDWKVIKPYLEAGFPLPAEYIPKTDTGTGHAFVIQGWKEDDKGTYVYKHNGNGGVGDGWISTSEVTNVFLFFPKMRVQIDRLPSHTSRELEVSWAFPEQYMKLYSETELSGFQFKVINPYNKGSAEIDEELGREVRSKKVSFSGTGTYYISIVPNFYSKNIAPSVVEDTFMIEVSSANYEEPKIEYAPPSVEASFGETSFEVKCSKSVASIDLHPGILTIHENESFPMESALSVVKKSEGLFQVTINAAKLPTRFNHQKMILTLEAKDRNWVADYADVLVEFKTSASSGTDPENPGTDSEKQPDYILISPKDFVGDWTKYVEKRKIAHPELTFAVKNAAEIYSAYGDKGGNPADMIKSYIAQEAAKGTKYFVLGAAWSDGDTISKSELSFVTGGGKDFSKVALTLDNTIPGYYRSFSGKTLATDYPYALIDGDEKPDVVVSRIPLVRWPDEMTGVFPTFTEIIEGYAEKVAAVESENFSGRHRYSCVGGQAVASVSRTSEFWPKEPHRYADGYFDFYDSKHPDSCADGEIAARRRFRNYFAMNNPVLGAAVIPMGTKVDDFFDDKLGWEAIVAKSHGLADSSCGTGVDDVHFRRTDTIIKFGIFAMPCLTGRPDWTDTIVGQTNCLRPSLGVAAICNPSGGEVVGFHNTHDGAGEYNVGKVTRCEDPYSTQYEGYLLAALFEKRLNAGEAWVKAHCDYIEKQGSGTWHLWTMYEAMLYGDPLIKVSSIKEGEKVCGPGKLPAKVLFK